MTVEIDWSEEVSYHSKLSVPRESFLTWLAERTTRPLERLETTRLHSLVRTYLEETEAVGDASWFDQCSITEDCSGVVERTLDDVTTVVDLTVSHPGNPTTERGNNPHNSSSSYELHKRILRHIVSGR